MPETIGVLECLVANIAASPLFNRKYSAEPIIRTFEIGYRSFKERINESSRKIKNNVLRLLNEGRFQATISEAIDESNFSYMNRENSETIDTSVNRVYNLHGEAAGVYDYCRRDSEHPMTVKQIVKIYDIPQAKLLAAVDRRNLERRAFTPYTDIQKENIANYIDDAISRKMTVSEMSAEIANGETNFDWLNERGASASTLYRTMKEHNILTPSQQGIDRRRKESVELEELAA